MISNVTFLTYPGFLHISAIIFFEWLSLNGFFSRSKQCCFRLLLQPFCPFLGIFASNNGRQLVRRKRNGPVWVHDWEHHHPCFAIRISPDLWNCWQLRLSLACKTLQSSIDQRICESQRRQHLEPSPFNPAVKATYQCFQSVLAGFLSCFFFESLTK